MGGKDLDLDLHGEDLDLDLGGKDLDLNFEDLTISLRDIQYHMHMWHINES